MNSDRHRFAALETGFHLISSTLCMVYDATRATQLKHADSPSTVTVALDSAKALAVAVATAWAAALAAAWTLPLPHAEATASDTAFAVAVLASVKVWELEVATAVTEPARKHNKVVSQLAGKHPSW
jgi:hypothetical protein